MGLDEALDQLYGATLEEFTAERNRLVKDLRAAGDDEAGATIKALRKPSVSAWAVNQLARRLPEDLDVLVRLHEQLGHAKDGKELRRVQDERKRTITRLSDAAATILEEAGHSAASATMQRVSQTLLAASSGDGLQALQRGRLAADLEPSGFGAVSGFDLAADSRPFQKEDRKARDRAEDLSRRATEAETHAADARRAADEAASEAERLRKDSDRAVKRAQQARAKAEQALDRLS